MLKISNPIQNFQHFNVTNASMPITENVIRDKNIIQERILLLI